MNYQHLIETHPELFRNENALLKVILDPQVIARWAAERRVELKKKGDPESWSEIGVVYQDPYITILRDLVSFPDGHLGSYFRLVNTADIRGGKATAILPIFENKVVLMRQYRHPTRSWHWEAPRGFGEPNTPPEDNARKELQEEIEGVAYEIIDLGSYNSNTGIEGVNVQLYYAGLSALGKTSLNEGIQSYRLFEISQFEQMIRDAEITDGFTIAAYTRAKLRALI